MLGHLRAGFSGRGRKRGWGKEGRKREGDWIGKGMGMGTGEGRGGKGKGEERGGPILTLFSTSTPIH